MRPDTHIPHILVTGSSGQLGNELQALQQQGQTPPGWRWFFTSHARLDITDTAAVAAFCQEHGITAIINCAAYTAVDRAETEPEAADAINHRAVAGLATIARQQGLSLIHISTDYVFAGTAHQPYAETNPTGPLNAYGRSKLAGEQALLAINPPRSAIIRSGWLYSAHGHNFVNTVLRLCRERGDMAVVADQTGTPTLARDLAKILVLLLPRLHNVDTEVFHFSHAGACTWHEFATAIAGLAGLDCAIRPVSSADFAAPAPRPAYSVLDKGKISRYLGIAIPDWREALAAHLKPDLHQA